MSYPFFTIGHSARTTAAFIELLRHVDVQMVADVRAFPISRHNPQFNAEALAKALLTSGIGYEHIAELGGLRGRSSNVAASTNAFWTNKSFHNYADYAMSGAFHSGLERLRDLGHRQRCAIMCSEAVWWRCHRRIISDYLIAAGEPVFHILEMDFVAPDTMTAAAEPGAAGILTYPENLSGGSASLSRKNLRPNLL